MGDLFGGGGGSSTTTTTQSSTQVNVSTTVAGPPITIGKELFAPLADTFAPISQALNHQLTDVVSQVAELRQAVGAAPARPALSQDMILLLIAVGGIVLLLVTWK